MDAYIRYQIFAAPVLGLHADDPHVCQVALRVRQSPAEFVQSLRAEAHVDMFITLVFPAPCSVRSRWAGLADSEDEDAVLSRLNLRSRIAL